MNKNVLFIFQLGEIYFPENAESESCVFEGFEATVSCNSYEKVGGLEMRDLALVYAHKVRMKRQTTKHVPKFRFVTSGSTTSIFSVIFLNTTSFFFWSFDFQ